MKELKNVLIEKHHDHEALQCNLATVPIYLDFERYQQIGTAALRREDAGWFADIELTEALPPALYFPAIGFTVNNSDAALPVRKGFIDQMGLCGKPNKDATIFPIEVKADGSMEQIEFIAVPEGPYLCILDIETGGFSKQKNGLAEIAVVIINHAGEVAGRIGWLIKPYPRPVDLQETPGQLVSYKPDAMAVNGLTIEKLEAEGATAEQVAEALEYILHDYQIDTLIGHNAKAFDHPWVEYFLERFGTSKKIQNVIDTMTMAKDQHRGLPSYKLQDLCKHFGIETTDQHRAGGDTEATRKLFLHLSPVTA